MDDFSQRVLYDYYAGRSPAKTIQEYADNPTQKLLLEAAAMWVMVQALVARDLLNEPKVELWGMQNIDDWDILNNNQKINAMFELWNKEGATKEAKSYIDQHSDASRLDEGGWIYDIKDLNTPYDGSIADHQSELQKSKVFAGLKELYLSYLVRHMKQEPQLRR